MRYIKLINTRMYQRPMLGPVRRVSVMRFSSIRGAPRAAVNQLFDEQETAYLPSSDNLCSVIDDAPNSSDIPSSIGPMLDANAYTRANLPLHPSRVATTAYGHA